MNESLVKSLLDYVFSVLSVFCYSDGHGESPVLVAKNQFFKSVSVSALCGSHQNSRVLAWISCTTGFHNSIPPFAQPRTTVRKQWHGQSRQMGTTIRKWLTG